MKQFNGLIHLFKLPIKENRIQSTHVHAKKNNEIMMYYVFVAITFLEHDDEKTRMQRKTSLQATVLIYYYTLGIFNELLSF